MSADWTGQKRKYLVGSNWISYLHLQRKTQFQSKILCMKCYVILQCIFSDAVKYLAEPNWISYLHSHRKTQIYSKVIGQNYSDSDCAFLMIEV